MKKLYMLLIVISLTMTFKTFGQKIAHFDTDLIMKEYSKAKSAKVTLEKLAAQLDTVLSRKEQSLKQKVKEFKELEKDKNTLKIILEDKAKEIQSLDKEIRTFQQKSVEQLKVKESQLLEPILKEVQTTIDEIGKEGNYDFIIKKEALLYELPGEDISKVILTKLNARK